MKRNTHKIILSESLHKIQINQITTLQPSFGRSSNELFVFRYKVLANFHHVSNLCYLRGMYEHYCSEKTLLKEQ